jgi:hypothetical protein
MRVDGASVRRVQLALVERAAKPAAARATA